MEAADGRARVNAAIASFLANDIYLIEHVRSALPRASPFTFRLPFDDLVVDVEYNRGGDLMKRLRLPECAKKRGRDERALVLL
jgi:hypothetical protein